MSKALEHSLFSFESTSNHAVVRLYRKNTLSAEDSLASLSEENSVTTGSESESIFLVYLWVSDCAYFTCMR